MDDARVDTGHRKHHATKTNETFRILLAVFLALLLRLGLVPQRHAG